jgi:hypothetical protein
VENEKLGGSSSSNFEIHGWAEGNSEFRILNSEFYCCVCVYSADGEIVSLVP